MPWTDHYLFSSYYIVYRNGIQYNVHLNMFQKKKPCRATANNITKRKFEQFIAYWVFKIFNSLLTYTLKPFMKPFHSTIVSCIKRLFKSDLWFFFYCVMNKKYWNIEQLNLNQEDPEKLQWTLSFYSFKWKYSCIWFCIFDFYHKCHFYI